LASLSFYAYANLKFIPFLLGIGLITYVSGLAIRSRRSKLIAGIFIAFELLPIIAARAITFSGSSLIIPLGISFFTLQAVTYTVSVYKGELEPETNPITILAFVTFFPAISSGPIQRAKDLIPLLKSPNPEFDYNQSTDGLKLMAWGLFKKLVIADNLALYIQGVRDPNVTPTGTALFLAAVLYSFQLYLDFSGYSDIAIGSAKALGYDLKKNFDHPYLSKSMGEFWRRWHISLSTWLRDYIYIPLGGSRKGKARTYLNTMIVFLVSGIWHGANWTFILWGILHGLAQCFNKITHGLYEKIVAGVKKLPAAGILIRLIKALQWIVTFVVINILWLLFRADSVTMWLQILKRFSVEYYVVREEILEPFRIPKLTAALQILGVAENAKIALWISLVAFMIFAFGICLFAPNNFRTKYNRNALSIATTWLLFILCLISLSTVSTFLYFNF
jgi:D-alanyl-lipoteichoic acid acyltransferase DltB (MBOAT superfamily)